MSLWTCAFSARGSSDPSAVARSRQAGALEHFPCFRHCRGVQLEKKCLSLRNSASFETFTRFLTMHAQRLLHATHLRVFVPCSTRRHVSPRVPFLFSTSTAGARCDGGCVLLYVTAGLPSLHCSHIANALTCWSPRSCRRLPRVYKALCRRAAAGRLRPRKQLGQQPGRRQRLGVQRAPRGPVCGDVHSVHSS